MEILELGKIPVSKESPCGADVLYEPEYEDLQSEIDKLASPTSLGGIDWERVIKLSSDILADKSKHILVASYLCVALVHSRGLEGLEQGLVIYRDLIENFWEMLFPSKKRMRARQNAVEWWKEKILSAVKSLPEDSVLTEEKVNSLNENIGAIDAFLDDHLDDAPSLHQLQQSIAAMQLQDVPEESEKEEAESGRALKSKTSSVLLSEKAEPTETAELPESEIGALSEKESQKILNIGLEAFSRVATSFMLKDPSNAMSYRMTRVAAWLSVETVPPSENGKTRISPPMPEIRNALENLYKQKNFKGLLESAEARVGQFLFWLDLSHYVASALEHLGFIDARQAVANETASYIYRLSGIENLSFSDGTPFADKNTKEWLADIALDKDSGEGGYVITSGDSSGASEESHIEDVYRQACVLAKQKKMDKAVKLMQENLRGGKSQRACFLWRIALTRFLINSKKVRVALPHFSEILKDIEKYNLDNWDPDLTLKALAEIYKGLKVQKDKIFQEQAVKTLDHMARLNPAAVLMLME